MSEPPRSTIPHHGVEDREQLPHARHQRHLLGLARLNEALVELPDEGVVLRGDHGAHVECGPHPRPATPHLSLASYPTGVAVERSYAYQGREALVGDGPQLGKLGQEGAGERRSDTGDTAQEGLILTPDGARLENLFELEVGAGKLLLKPPHMRPNTPLNWSGDYRRETIVLSDEHADQLAAPTEDLAKKQGFLPRESPWLGLERLGEAGEDIGVDLVSLRQGTCRLGEVPRLARIDHRHRDPRGGEGCRSRALKAACCLQDHQLGTRLLEPSDQRVDALGLISKRVAFAGGAHGHIQTCLRDVHPSIALHGCSSAHRASFLLAVLARPCGYGLRGRRLRRSSAAQAAVRALPLREGATTRALYRSPKDLGRERSVAPALAAVYDRKQRYKGRVSLQDEDGACVQPCALSVRGHVTKHSNIREWRILGG